MIPLLPVLQAVFDYSYGPDVPLEVREGCNADNISLLNAEDCLFYRYDRLGWIKYIWAIGLLAAGQSSTMTVCTCSQNLCIQDFTQEGANAKQHILLGGTPFLSRCEQVD